MTPSKGARGEQGVFGRTGRDAAANAYRHRSQAHRADQQRAAGALIFTCEGAIMKTSVIEVHDLLSVLSVDEVETRIGEVPGVESVTVNFAAASATVRYDETRLVAADIKSVVRQRGYEPSTPSGASDGDEHKDPLVPPATLGVAGINPAPIVPPVTETPAPSDAQQKEAASPEASQAVSPAGPEGAAQADQAEAVKK
jgi:Cu2+-exporting ATPase